MQLIAAFLRSKNSQEQFFVYLRSVFANIRRPLMETVSVLPFGKLRRRPEEGDV